MPNPVRGDSRGFARISFLLVTDDIDDDVRGGFAFMRRQRVPTKSDEVAFERYRVVFTVVGQENFDVDEDVAKSGFC